MVHKPSFELHQIGRHMSKHGSVTRLTVVSTARTRLTTWTTARTRLTTWTPDDFADLHELHADPAVMTFLRRGTPEPPEETHRRLDTYLREQESPGWTKWRVEDLSGQMIGRAGFSPLRKDRELGYTLAQHTWGEGLATEIARALVQWHRDHPFDGSGVAYAESGNLASRRVLEKAGFNFVGERDQGGHPQAFYELPAIGA